MNNNFEIIFLSDSQYEKLTAEIHFRGQILCQINNDKGIDDMEIEFFHEMYVLSEEVKIKFPLEEFMQILMEAKQDLNYCPVQASDS